VADARRQRVIAVGVKDASCTEVCSVDCIHPTPDPPKFATAEQLYIDPEECIDCDACVQACPADAITPEDMVPPEWQDYIEKNAAYFRREWARSLRPSREERTSHDHRPRGRTGDERPGRTPLPVTTVDRSAPLHRPRGERQHRRL
jgi:NAD-dependent dihydropyrimidine dehydrogenase PreA subunit